MTRSLTATEFLLLPKKNSVRPRACASHAPNGLTQRARTEDESDQAKIVTIARTQHQAMISKAHRMTVAVDGRMLHVEIGMAPFIA